MKILAIETSCDETAIAIAEFSDSREQSQTQKPQTNTDKNTNVNVLANLVSSQVKLHAKYGGVVPNLAKREHQKNLVPLLLRALKEAITKDLRFKNQDLRIKNTRHLKSKILNLKSILERESELLKQFEKKITPLSIPDIDAIAVTYGPGLAPALWVGVNFAKALALLWDKPLIPINHMEGHLFSALLKQRSPNFPASPKTSRDGQIPISNQIKNPKSQNLPPTTYHLQPIKFPALALLVSGGHTELVLVKGFGKYKIIGETLDDAAGEAFDKVARILGLPYPGGPHISALAEIADEHELKKPLTNAEKKSANVRDIKSPRMSAFQLPRPMIRSNDFNFSFSGLKTAVLYLVRDLSKKYSIKKLRPAIAKEFQEAVVEVLVKKTIDAAKKHKTKTILLGGGVAANKLLRKKLEESIKSDLQPTTYHLPASKLTGDNALMIALAAFLNGKKKAPNKIGADANVSL